MSGNTFEGIASWMQVYCKRVHAVEGSAALYGQVSLPRQAILQSIAVNFPALCAGSKEGEKKEPLRIKHQVQ